MLVDAHCHLDHFLYRKDIQAVINRAKSANVKFIITNGIDYETNLLSLDLAKKYPEIIKVALGFYPPDALDREYDEENKKGAKNILSKKNIEENISLIEKNKEAIVAIGEIGLDMYNGKNLAEQKNYLKKLINLALRINKPVILHTRKAEKETLEIIKEFGINPDRVVLHCFSGNKLLMNEAVKSGYNFSIPTNIVRSESFQYLAKICPINKILTETDGPYLSPFKNEDKSFNRNEPAYIPEAVKKIAKIKNLDTKKTEEEIINNFRRIFMVN